MSESTSIRRSGGFVVALAVAIGLLFAVPVCADTFNSYADYGHATNGYTGTNGGNAAGNYVAGPYCGATSVANSLQFLANKYGLTNLMSGTAEQTRDAIVDMETLVDNHTSDPPNNTYDGTGITGSPPVDNRTIWNSKVDYINQKAAGQVKVEARIPGDLSGYHQSGSIENSVPDLNWLLEQIDAGQDVEMAFFWTEPPPAGDVVNDELDADATDEPGEDSVEAHMVTLTGVDAEGGFQYLDPNEPGGLLGGTFGMEDGYLTFNWNNGNNDPVDGVKVYQAWAESPTPLPSTAAAGLLLVFGRGAYRKLGRARAA